MTVWTALIPLKAAPSRKTRLSAGFTADQRVALSDRFARHVAKAVLACPAISSVALVSDAPLGGLPVRHIRDRGMGLNVELARAVARLGGDHVVIVSADLPLLRSSDIEALLHSALAEGSAIAPDRHGTGTNALALVSARNCRFHFGCDSFVAHRGEFPAGAVVRRWGLALDVDTPDDFECAFGSSRYDFEANLAIANLPPIEG